jgi:hypothetical protein
MIRRIAIAASVTCLATVCIAVLLPDRESRLCELSTDRAPISHEQLMSRIRLIPSDERAGCFLEKAILGGVGERSLAVVANRHEFDRWKQYEDDVLSFAYPDDPHITLEIKRPRDRITIDGDPVRSEWSHFSKACRLAVGEHTYGLLMVENTDSFDDSICFCGAEVFQKYLFLNGALYRFSLLATGQIKKIQLLGNGVRVVLLEWTHSAMTQEVYAKTALSIRLKSPVLDQLAMTKKVCEEYGGFGFLESGMNRSQIVQLLGQPNEESETLLTFVRTRLRWRTSISIPLQDGVFGGFCPNWQKDETLPPQRGSADWILETARDIPPATTSGSNAMTTSAEVSYMYERFIEIGPTANDWEWDSLCKAIFLLHEVGYADERVLPIVQNRFPEMTPNQLWAARFLHKYDSSNNDDLFCQKIRRILNEAKKHEETTPEEDPYPVVGWDDNTLYNLFVFLGKKHPQRLSLILEALDHPCVSVRRLAYSFVDNVPDDFPEADATPRLLKGLEDSDAEIRRSASNAFAASYGYGSKADIPALKKRASLESDEGIRNNLESAIERLERQK